MNRSLARTIARVALLAATVAGQARAEGVIRGVVYADDALRASIRVNVRDYETTTRLHDESFSLGAGGEFSLTIPAGTTNPVVVEFFDRQIPAQFEMVLYARLSPAVDQVISPVIPQLPLAVEASARSFRSVSRNAVAALNLNGRSSAPQATLPEWAPGLTSWLNEAATNPMLAQAAEQDTSILADYNRFASQVAPIVARSSAGALVGGPVIHVAMTERSFPGRPDWDRIVGLATELPDENQIQFDFFNIPRDGGGAAVVKSAKTAKFSVGDAGELFAMDADVGKFTSQDGVPRFSFRDGRDAVSFDLRREGERIETVPAPRVELPPIRGSLLATSGDGSKQAISGRDGVGVEVFTVADGARTPVRTLETGPIAVISATFNPAGTVLATGTATGSLTLWDLSTGQPKLTEKLSSPFITSIKFSPKGGRCVATAGLGRDEQGQGTIFVCEKRDDLWVAVADQVLRGTSAAAVELSADGSTLGVALPDRDQTVFYDVTREGLRPSETIENATLPYFRDGTDAAGIRRDDLGSLRIETPGS